MATTTPRRRGPRATGDARSDILAAARSEFADKGYAAASVRGIARLAEVDPALVHHYFAGKSQLFAATMDLELDPHDIVRKILDGPRQDAGQRLVRTFLAIWDAPERRAQVAALVRSMFGGPPEKSPVREFVLPELIMRVCTELQVDDPARRAGLIASQMLGLIAGRYVLQLPPVVALGAEDMVRTYGETIRRYLFD